MYLTIPFAMVIFASPPGSIWLAIVLTLFLLIITVVVYRLYFHPLVDLQVQNWRH